MKKIIYYILFNIIFIFSTNTFAWNFEYNTEFNIKKAILVEDYIIRHKSKIEDFIHKYNINNNSNINNHIKEYEQTIEILKKTQNTNIEKEKAEEIIKVVIIKIKEINDTLKSKLKVEKEKYTKKLEIKKLNYFKLWKKLSKKIDNINIKIATKIFKNKTILSFKESKIKLTLLRLNKESVKLRNFWNNKFNSEMELKKSFMDILNNIKKEIKLIKNELK